MSVTEDIHDKLVAAFSPQVLKLINESDLHSGPKGRESHFKVVLVAEIFDGWMLVKRHRAIHEVLAAELAEGLHALSIEALSPAQWAARGGEVLESPPCGGGGK